MVLSVRMPELGIIYPQICWNSPFPLLIISQETRFCCQAPHHPYSPPPLGCRTLWHLSCLSSVQVIPSCGCWHLLPVQVMVFLGLSTFLLTELLPESLFLLCHFNHLPLTSMSSNPRTAPHLEVLYRQMNISRIYHPHLENWRLSIAKISFQNEGFWTLSLWTCASWTLMVVSFHRHRGRIKTESLQALSHCSVFCPLSLFQMRLYADCFIKKFNSWQRLLLYTSILPSPRDCQRGTGKWGIIPSSLPAPWGQQVVLKSHGAWATSRQFSTSWDYQGTNASFA